MPGKRGLKDELTSWQEIADYLGVNVRTAQKWEKKQGLPIRRLLGRISASSGELDRWKGTIRRKPSWFSNLSFLRHYSLATSALLLLGLGIGVKAFIPAGDKSPPERFELDSRTLIVKSRDGHELWKKVFESPFYRHAIDAAANQRTIWFGDLDRDSEVETLFAYYPVSREKTGADLLCFSQTGLEKWRFKAGRPVADGLRDYSNVYLVANFLVRDLDGNGEQEILVSSHHISEYPNQFVVLDATGNIRAEYWHSGHLEHLETGDLDGDGRDEILLGGVNNGYHSASLIVLDGGRLFGTSGQGERDEYQLQGFDSVAEEEVTLFPRTCINKRFEEFNKVRSLAVLDETIKVNVAEREKDPNCEVIYILDHNLNVLNVDFSLQLRNLHRELESKGELDHSLSEAEIAQMASLRVGSPPGPSIPR